MELEKLRVVTTRKHYDTVWYEVGEAHTVVKHPEDLNFYVVASDVCWGCGTMNNSARLIPKADCVVITKECP